MRTVLITNGNLLSLLSLGDWLRQHHAQLAAVLVTTRLPSQKNNVVGVLSMLRASGWGYTHFKLLTNVLLPRKLRRLGLPASVEDYLRRLGARTEVWPTPYVNRPEVVERVRSLRPEILMSFSATTRFKDPLLETPTRAAINTHYALLPAYAGLSPYFWYLRNAEPECGVTLHRIVPKLDAGPIIEQQRFATAGLRTVFAVLREQMARVSPMMNRYYAGETSEQNATPQDLSRRSYYGHPTHADVRVLRAAGHTFYDRRDIALVITRLRELTD